MLKRCPEVIPSGWHWLIPALLAPPSVKYLSHHPFAAGVAFSMGVVGALWHHATWWQAREVRLLVKP